MKRRAVLVVIRRANAPERIQWAQLLEYATLHDLHVTALIRWSTTAAIDLVRRGHADVVVAVSPANNLDRIHDIDVEFVRPPAQPVPRGMIRLMLHRGGDPLVIAQLLDLPIDVVLEVQTQVSASLPAALAGTR